MVECELKVVYHIELMSGGFNRYMVECEFAYYERNIINWAVLIDTWWNVNYCLYHSGISASGFNRYMVECESNVSWFFYDFDSGFNRYMVECEFQNYMMIWLHVWVLIDTWWNVNWNQVVPDEYVIAVLIDTWWNVNFTHADCLFICVVVLIDTWWNVNLQLLWFGIFLHIVLIDTWWNVNVLPKTFAKIFDEF